MFLAPCTLPLVPAFLVSLMPGDRGNTNKSGYTRELLMKTVLFSSGFTLVFVLFGILTGFFGAVFMSYKLILSQIGGVFIIIFGFSLLNIVRIPVAQNSVSQIGKIILKKNNISTSLILGGLFALGWTPCAGTILISILLLASQSGTAFHGGMLLAVFSLGLAVPFILVGALYAHTVSVFNFYETYRSSITIVSGIFLVTIGFILLFGYSLAMTQWGFQLYSFFGFTPMCTYR